MASKVLQFVNTLLPRAERQQLLESIQRTQNELTTVAIPMYEKSAEMEKLGGYKSDLFKEFNMSSKTNVRTASGHIIKDTLKALKNHNVNLGHLAEVIMRDTGDDITIESITYRKANVMQLIAGIQGFVRYSTRMLGLLWLCETGDVSVRSITEIRQPEYLWLVKNRSVFFSVLEVGLQKPDRLARSINAMPDMTVTPESDASVESGLGKQNTVIAGFTVSWSPILHVRRFIDRLRESETERVKAERQWLQDCYNRALADKQNGSKNPAVEKRLKVYGDKLSQVDQTLERLSVATE